MSDPDELLKRRCRKRARCRDWAYVGVLVACVSVAGGFGASDASATTYGAQTTVAFSGLNGPAGLAVDHDGDVFVVDANNNRVLELPAGSSTQRTLPFTGLDAPLGMALDQGGDVFVADSDNDRVVELPAGATSASQQTTLGFSGLLSTDVVGVDRAGDVFVSDGSVVELPAGSSIQQTLPFSGLYFAGLAVDPAGDVFAADLVGNRVEELPAGSGTQAPLSFSGLDAPDGMAVDQAGDVFVTDYDNDRVVELPAGSSIQQTLPFAGLKGPRGVAVDQAGDVFVADAGNNRVLELPIAQTLSVTLAGSGTGSVSGGGIACPGTCSAIEAQNSQVTLTATAASGSTFAGWSGGGCSGAGTCVVAMSTSQSVTATFTPVIVSGGGGTGGGGTGGGGTSGGGTGVGSPQTDSSKGSVISLAATGATASLRVKCVGPAGGSCSGPLMAASEVTMKGRSIVAVAAPAPTATRAKATMKVETVASGSFSLAVGQSETFMITLNRAGIGLLSRFYRLPATLWVGGSVSLSKVVTFNYRLIPALTTYTWAFNPTFTVAQQLMISNIPADGSVTALCHGGGCPFTRTKLEPKRGSVDLTASMAHSRLTPGAMFTLLIQAPNEIGKVTAFTIRGGQAPAVTKQCLPPAARKPTTCR